VLATVENNGKGYWMRFNIGSWLKLYFWPFSVPGYVEVSPVGREIQKNKMNAWKNGTEYFGPRESIYVQSDKVARGHNRKRLIHFLPTYVKRWSVLSLVLLALAQGFADLNVFFLEVVFTLSTVTSFFVAAFLTWFWKDLSALEKEPKN
jgi:hypothetical protein